MSEEKKENTAQNSEPALTVKKDPLTVHIRNYFNPKGTQLEMLRYRPNKGSYVFGLLALVFLALAFCIFYSSTGLPSDTTNFNLFGSHNPGPWYGIDIVINILMMLFMLFASIEMKSYSLELGYVSLVIGAFQVIRPFLLPLSLANSATVNQKAAMKPVIFTLVLTFYIVSGACSILAGFLSIYRGTALRRYLKTVKPIENEKVRK